ncbi:MAG: hypothetical protein H6667_19465 [Ardenticatenaceae bacterium]|nr:hypothetical protein [Ardenticatenaceae bacterium]
MFGGSIEPRLACIGRASCPRPQDFTTYPEPQISQMRQLLPTAALSALIRVLKIEVRF